MKNLIGVFGRVLMALLAMADLGLVGWLLCVGIPRLEATAAVHSPVLCWTGGLMVVGSIVITSFLCLLMAVTPHRHKA